MNRAHMIRGGLVALAAAAFGIPAGPLAAQMTGGGIALSGFGGITTDPGGFDVFRDTEFDAAYHVGVGLTFRLGPNVGVRGDVSKAWSSGTETTVLAGEEVDFSRTYYGVAVEARFPLSSITPYVLVGGGMVSLDRSAPSRDYSFSEVAGRAGAGLAYRFPGSAFELFIEGSEWFYDRSSTGEGQQFDTSINVGLTFVPNL